MIQEWGIHVIFKLRLSTYFLLKTQNGVLNRYSFSVQKFLLVSVNVASGRPNRLVRKAILERARSQSFFDTKNDCATPFGCPEISFFPLHSTASHPVDLLASKWCMVSSNGHLLQLPITELTGKVNICRNKVLKHSLPSIIMSPCIRLLTRLCARRSTLRLHFWQCRQRQNTRQR